jgi:ketosteroid isomerase-like protein
VRFFILLTAIFLAAFPATAQPVQPNIALEALRYIDAQEAVMAPDAGPKQVDALLAFYTDDYIYYHPQFGAKVVGPDAHRRGVMSHLGEMTDAAIEIRGIQVNGNMVSLSTVERFRVKTDGTAVMRPRFTVLTFRDGKIVQRVDI